MYLYHRFPSSTTATTATATSTTTTTSAYAPTTTISGAPGTTLSLAAIIGIVAAIVCLFGGLAVFVYCVYRTTARRRDAVESGRRDEEKGVERRTRNG